MSPDPEVPDMLLERTEHSHAVHTALPCVSHLKIQSLHGDSSHNLVFDMPRDGTLMGTCGITDQDIGAGKKKGHGKRGYRVY